MVKAILLPFKCSVQYCMFMYIIWENCIANITYVKGVDLYMKWCMVRPHSQTCNNEFVHLSKNNRRWYTIVNKAETSSLHKKRSLANYVKGVHENNSVVNVEKMYIFFLEKHKFVIPKWLNMDIILIYGNLWFPCVNSPESAVCHVTGINNEHILLI